MCSFCNFLDWSFPRWHLSQSKSLHQAPVPAAAAAAADGRSSGLLMLNSNGMEVQLEPVKLTYRWDGHHFHNGKLRPLN
jgi:hypothetical protein